MARLLKYYLSLLTLFLLIGCKDNPYSHLSLDERKRLSSNTWDKENKKHGFNGHYQGSPEVQELIDKILEIDPENCDALRERSIPYLKRGLPHKWKPLFDKAVKCDPATWKPWRGYLLLYFYRDYKKAISDFNASDTLTPNFVDTPQGVSVNYWRGMAYLGMGDLKNSINYFKTHIAIESKESGEDWVTPESFLYLGITHYENGELEEAKINFKKVLQYSINKSADANYYLAKINFDLKKHSNAQDYILKAISDYNEGYYRYRAYVEEIRQIYPSELEALKTKIQEAE